MRVAPPAGLPAILIVSMVWLAPGGGVARATSSAKRAGGLPQATTLVVRDREGAGLRDPRPPTVAAAASGYRRFEGKLLPLEEKLLADAADGRLDEHTLLGAALIAGGVEDAQRVAQYRAKLDGLVDRLQRSGKVTGPARRKARAIFEFMHGQVLRGGYQLNSSDLGAALDEGRFNCVSASVLFNCLAERFGLEVCGLEIPGHAMSRVVLSEGVLDIETTCPRWFDLMHDPEKQADLVEQTTGFRHPRNQKQSAAQRREVSGTGLVATIYYNRGVDLLAAGKYAGALAANAKALRLDPTNTTARGNLLATLNNWAISLGRSGRHAEAVARLRLGLTLDPAYETFAANFVHVHHQWAETLCRGERFQEALDLLVRAEEESPQTRYFSVGQFEVYRRWATALLEAGRTERALAVFVQARRRHGTCPGLLQAEAAAVNDHALRLAGEGRFEEALALLDRGLAAQPDSPLLRANRRAVVMRWAEPAFQSGDYAEAIRRTTRGAATGRLHEALAGNVRYGYYYWISGLLAEGRREEAEQVRRQALADPFLQGQAGSAIPPFDAQ